MTPLQLKVLLTVAIMAKSISKNSMLEHTLMCVQPNGTGFPVSPGNFSSGKEHTQEPSSPHPD